MDPVKFLKDSEDRIEGLAIPYGGPASGKDLDGEKFTASTDFALDWYPNGRPLLYDHGTDSELGVQVIGRQDTVKAIDSGMWIEAQLNRAHDYWDKVKELVSDGKLYFSSGSVGHLVKTAADGTIKRWPWVENSLTPTPANPYATVGMKRAMAATKALGLAVPPGLVDPEEDDDSTDDPPAVDRELRAALAEAHIILAQE